MIVDSDVIRKVATRHDEIQMIRPVATIIFGMLTSLLCAGDWPVWRGPNGDNHAAPDTDAPLKWDIDSGQNIVWKTPIPGRGHSTPIVVNDWIFLTTSDVNAKTQSLIKVNRTNGRLIDQWVLHRDTLPSRIHPNNSHASPTPAFDGDHLFVVFYTDDAIWLTKMSPSGREVWKKKVSNFRPTSFRFGYGASPIIEDDLVIIAAEYDGGDSGLYALDRATGRQVWKASRPINLNFASPIGATIAGQRQILLAGANTISSYDPQNGREIWSVESSTEAVCGTVVWDGRRVMVSGGNPVAGTWCIMGDGSRTSVWENRIMCYEQSLLAIKGYVFAVADNGVVYCWRTVDGVEMWKKRLFAGRVSASPLLVNNRIYICSERGGVYVISASPSRFDLLSECQTGNSIFASPVAVDDRLYIRTGVGYDEDRQEYLLSIGQTTNAKPSN